MNESNKFNKFIAGIICFNKFYKSPNMQSQKYFQYNLQLGNTQLKTFSYSKNQYILNLPDIIPSGLIYIFQSSIMHLQEHLQQDSLLLYPFLLILAILVTYLVHKKLQTKKRLSIVRCRPLSQTKKDKIIVACQLENVFVNMSDIKRTGFTKINIQTGGFKHLIAKVKELFGIGVYYKLSNPRKDIKSYIQTLAENSKVQLFLYTTLSLKVAEELIEKLGITNFFKPNCRRSCSDGYSQALKHPTEVDFNTKRVIILTGSNKDHLQEDSKYFLVIKKKKLNDSIKRLNDVIKRNGDIDELHNELADLKDQIESDNQNYS